MAEEMKEKDPAWKPCTPSIQHQHTSTKRKRVARKEGCNNGEMPDDLKMKSTDDIGPSNRKGREKMKRHRPKVINENKPVKTPKPSTPEPKTQKAPRQARKVRKKVDRPKRKLEFCEESSALTVMAEGPKTIKRKRKMRRRLSLGTLIRLVGMINEKSCDCESTILSLSWINLKRRRSKTTCIRRQDFSWFLLEDFQVADAQCEHSDDNAEKTVMVEPTNILPYQDDAVQDALIDFATQKMESLGIGDVFDEPVGMQLVDCMMLAPRHRKPRVDIDEESTRSWKLFLQGVEDTEEKENDNKDDRKAYLEEEKKLFVKRVDAFNAFMFAILGDRRFKPWKGSVVDSVVGVFLTQNVSDNLSSNAFLDLAAKYPPPSLREQNGGDAIEYVVQEPLSPRREESNPNIEGEIDASSSSTKAIPVEIDVSSSTAKAIPVEIDVSSSTAKAIPVEIDVSSSTAKATPGRKNKRQNIKNGEENWDNLRKIYSDSNSRKRVEYNADTIDWNAVREASLDELAEVIKNRGMNYQLAERIKNFLDRLVRDHCSIDLEWLRNVPPLKAKSYLMSISGLALKSTECVRLLSLYQPAFPIDVNVCRVLVRLGWVKLQPLPEGLPIHLLNDYPELSKVQEYIWPRICNRDEQTLYEFHCYMNIFSKAFCTKTNPNCNACPMKGDCKHYASALASSRLLLDGSQANNETSESTVVNQERMVIEGAIDNDHAFEHLCEPILEFPPSPEPEFTEPLGVDIEDFGCESEIQTIILNSKEILESPLLSSLDDDGGDKSKAVVDPQVAQIPMPKVKNKLRLRTEHQVYVLPDSHPLLAKFERRDLEDHCPYLLAIWTQDPCQESKIECESTISSEVVQHNENEIVKGSILIPCRTANRGRFPLNGTYFQINEVFADHDSSREPIDVPRAWIWNLPRLTLYCGTTITAICRGMSFFEIAKCFREGYICIREFDLKTRRSRILSKRFHFCKTRPIEEQ